MLHNHFICVCMCVVWLFPIFSYIYILAKVISVSGQIFIYTSAFAGHNKPSNTVGRLLQYLFSSSFDSTTMFSGNSVSKQLNLII